MSVFYITFAPTVCKHPHKTNHMRKIILLLLLALIPSVSINAQIIKKSNKDKIGKSIKKGFNDALKAIKQDAHPTGEHGLWDGYIGPKVGVGVSSMPGAGGRPEVGFLGGVFAEVFIAKNLGVSFELNYQHLGGNNVKYASINNEASEEGVTPTVVEGKYNYNFDYINTAYLLHWYPWSYRPMSFYTGLQMARLCGANSHMKGSTTADIKDDLFKGEFDIPVGATYEWKQWELDLRYYISPRKLARSPRAKRILGNARNQMLSLTVAYRIQIF